MNELLMNPWSIDAYTVERDSNGRGVVKAKIMKVGRLKYVGEDGKTYFGNIKLDALKAAIPTASIKPVTIKHPPGMLKPSDVMNYQEGISADQFDVEDLDDGTWLTGPVVLQSDKAIETAESGKLGVSAGYFRKAVPTGVDGEFDFTEIDINHIAIGCDNPRAEGAGLSLDEAGEDSATVYSFVKQQPKKSEVQPMAIKQILNAVKVGDFSMDESPIEFEEQSENAVKLLVTREGQLTGQLLKVTQSMDDAEKDHVEKLGELSGTNKGLTSKVDELEKKMEGMISHDDIEARVAELADIQAVANHHKIETKFKTPLEGKRAVVEAAYPDQSFDDTEVEGAYKTIQVDEKDVSERMKSNAALKKSNETSLDEKKVPLSKVDPKDLLKKSKKS